MKSMNVLSSRPKIVSVTILAVLLVSSILSFIPLVMATTPEGMEEDYHDDYGVLGTDTYILYPWEEESLNFGFSKYGELINPDVPIGLEYKGVDAFASDALNPVDWSNGWLMDIHYVEDGQLKNVWAYALFSDLEEADEDWKQEQSSRDGSAVGDEYGGRRTSGYCITDPIRVIYDGPRRSIYLLSTTIYDKDPADYGDAMIRLDIQLVFNKVKKYVVEIKDIKRLEQSKWTGPFQVEFSQRGEWDIGTTSVCNSYAEFYNGLETKYYKHPFYGTDTPEYDEARFDVCQMISTEEDVDLVGFWAFWPNLQSKWVDRTYGMQRSMVLSSLETREELHEDITTTLTTDYYAIKYPRGDGIWDSEPWVFADLGEGMYEYPTGWSWDESSHTLTFSPALPSGSDVIVLYKRGLETTHSKNRFGKVEHTGHGIGSGYSYGMSAEPYVPYVFGEWDFELSMDNEAHSTHQFRCVSVVGLTDKHDAYDGDLLSDPDTHNLDTIDEEVLFLLDEVFNPWDLEEAANKASFRWAQKGTLSGDIDLASHLWSHPDENHADCLDTYHKMVSVPFEDYSTDYYGRGSERVILYDEDGVLDPLLAIRGTHYNLNAVNFLIVEIAWPAGYDYYKVLYSTYLESSPSPELCWDTGRWEWIVVGRDSAAVDSAGAAMISAGWQEWKWKEVWLSALDMKSTMEAPAIPYVFRIFNPDGTYWEDYYYDYALEDYRAALKDDWCTPEEWVHTDTIYPYAISSSNIIVVGGPLANLGAEYFNDFTDAFVFSLYGEGFYSYACWARTSQPSINKDPEATPDELWYDSAVFTDDVGHAIVSTYLDLNGTVGFIVYGYTADDTYYASYAVRGGLLPWLQELQEGVTTLVITFNYTSLHPVGIHVEECLGTITECTGFDTNFKTSEYDSNFAAAKSRVESKASSYGLCYKLIDITWCAELHPDP
jgi:hypothetical protein